MLKVMFFCTINSSVYVYWKHVTIYIVLVGAFFYNGSIYYNVYVYVYVYVLLLLYLCDIYDIDILH